MSGGDTSTASTSSSPPPSVMNAYQGVMSRAQQVASQPLQQYDIGPNASNVVAGFNPTQQQAFNLIGQNTGTAQPYIGAAANEFGQATQPLWQGLPQFSADNVNKFLNPATQDVLNSTQQQFGILNQEQQNSLVGNAISQRAFGGDRAAVAQGVLGGQQAASEAPVLAGIAQQNYGQALQEFNQQQQAQLGANEANSWLASQAGFGLANLGGEAQNLNLSGANALLGVGNMQQQLAQEQLNVPFEQFQQQQAYPFQTTNFLAGIDSSIGTAMGGQSQTTQTQGGPSDASQAAGAGMAALALAAMFMNRGGGLPVRRHGGGLMLGPQQRFDVGGGIYSDPSAAMVPTIGTNPLDTTPLNPGSNAGRGAPPPPSTGGQGGSSSGGLDLGTLAQAAQIAMMFAKHGGGITAHRQHRAPGGGIYDDPSLALVPNMNLNIVPTPVSPRGGGGPPGAPSLAAGPQDNPMQDASAFANVASMYARSGNRSPSSSSGGIGGFGGSGLSDGEMASLSSDASNNLAAGIGAEAGMTPFRRGGIVAGYDEGGDVGDEEMVTPDVGRGYVPLRYVQGSDYQRQDWQPGDHPRPPAPHSDISVEPLAAPEGGHDTIPTAPTPQAQHSETSAGIAPAAPAAHGDASQGPDAWKLGLLSAGLGILGGRSRNAGVNIGRGAMQGLQTYMSETGRRDQMAQRQSEQDATAAYRKANLDLEAKKFSDAADQARQRLKIEGDHYSRSDDTAAQRAADEAAFHKGELGNSHERNDIERQRADDLSAYQAGELTNRRDQLQVERDRNAKGFWEPTAPVMENGQPKKDPDTGAPLYTWQDRTSMQTKVAPYSPQDGGRAGSKSPSASQWKYDAWLHAHPGDEQGAIDFVAGHKQMGDADIAKAAHGMAATDYRNFFSNGVPPKDSDAWMNERRETYAQQLRQGRQPAPGAPPAPAPGQGAGMPLPPAAERVVGKTTWTAPSGQVFVWGQNGWDEKQ